MATLDDILNGIAALSVFQKKSATPSITRTNATTSNATLLAANDNRLQVTIVNDNSTGILYLKFGAVATETSYSEILLPSETYRFPNGVRYTGQIDAIWSELGGAAQITEFV